jgi:apolipoprotein N-acyltransferase
LFKFWQRIPVTPEEKIRRNNHRLLGILSGIMLGLAFPPVPFPAALLLFFGLAPYFYVLEKKEKLIDINRFTYLTAFIFNLITIYWVGGWGKETDPFLMIGGGLLLFINPVFFLIPSTLYYITRKIFNKNLALFCFPFFWVTYEYSYMVTDASFPWVTLGNGLVYFNKFIQAADIIGALGLSLLVVYINIFVYKSYKYYKQFHKLSYQLTAAALLLFIIPLIYGIIRESRFEVSKKNIRVGLIQPNLDPWDKWAGATENNLWQITDRYFELSEKAAGKGAKLIIWPETALPVYLRNGAHQDIIDSIYNFIKRKNVYLLTGMPDFIYYRTKEKAPDDAKHSERFDYYYTTYNSVLLFSPYTFKIAHYGKMKLVPFGERVPFVDALPFLGDWIKWNVGISGWNVGKDTTVFNIVLKDSSIRPNANDTIKVNSLVCFESVFPAFVAAFSQKGAGLITVVTNDSWYGNSSGPYQHEAIGALRAVENRRSVVRAANGGISAIIDPLGNMVKETKMYTKDFIVGNVPVETGNTFYSRNPLIIPYISWMVSLLVLIISFSKKIMGIFNKKRTVT